MARAVGALGLRSVVVVVGGVDPRRQERARRRCLTALLWELDQRRVEQVVFESRQHRDAEDRQMIAFALRSGWVEPTMRYDFAAPFDECLLWLGRRGRGSLRRGAVGRRPRVPRNARRLGGRGRGAAPVHSMPAPGQRPSRARSLHLGRLDLSELLPVWTRCRSGLARRRRVPANYAASHRQRRICRREGPRPRDSASPGHEHRPWLGQQPVKEDQSDAERSLPDHAAAQRAAQRSSVPSQGCSADDRAVPRQARPTAPAATEAQCAPRPPPPARQPRDAPCGSPSSQQMPRTPERGCLWRQGRWSR